MRWKLIIAAAVILFITAALATRSEWDGDITETAATPLATEAGVAESHILPWRVEGDLLLFAFLTGGCIAGFVAGYYWRGLFSEKAGRTSSVTSAGSSDRRSRRRKAAE